LLDAERRTCFAYAPGSADAIRPVMAAPDYNLHDHKGLQWLAPFMAAFFITVIAAVMMMLYPHMLGA
jgi:hypothetical protein